MLERQRRKGRKADRQASGGRGASRKERRKEGIKRREREREREAFRGPRAYEDQRLLPGRIDIVASENAPARYKKERERRKHLESGIITRLIIYADHYFDGADRPPSITFVPPLVLPAILLSFRDPALPHIPLAHPSRPSPCRHGRSFIILKLFVSVTAKTDIINSLPLERITVKRAALG